MNQFRGFAAVATASVAAIVLVACGGTSDTAQTTVPTDKTTQTTVTPTQVSVVAKDFGFDVPATFRGGLVKMSYTNAGKEPHFAAFAKAAPGKTFADVKAALTAPPSATPPSGPPPFEILAAFPTGDPGTTGSLTMNLPAGDYALFCELPSPDGTPHTKKGMVTQVTVTDGPSGELPAAAATIKAVDFALSDPAPLRAGKNVVAIDNQGKQGHEINLIELPAGKTMDDVVAWAKAENGPPPMHFLTGVAVAAGAKGTAEFDLKPGATYAFACFIPDFLGDFAPHVTKGMRTNTFTVT